MPPPTNLFAAISDYVESNYASPKLTIDIALAMKETGDEAMHQLDYRTAQTYHRIASVLLMLSAEKQSEMTEVELRKEFDHGEG